MLTTSEIEARYRVFAPPGHNSLLLEEQKVYELIADCEANDLVVVGMDSLLYYGLIDSENQSVTPLQEYSPDWSRLLTNKAPYTRLDWEKERRQINIKAVEFLDNLKIDHLQGFFLEPVFISYEDHILYMKN